MAWYGARTKELSKHIKIRRKFGDYVIVTDINDENRKPLSDLFYHTPSNSEKEIRLDHGHFFGYSTSDGFYVNNEMFDHYDKISARNFLSYFGYHMLTESDVEEIVDKMDFLC